MKSSDAQDSKRQPFQPVPSPDRLLEIVGAIVLLGAIVAIRDRQAPAAAFAAALSLSYLVTLAIALFFARRHASLVPRFDRPEWSRLMRAALPLALGTTMTIATFQSPTVLIAVLGAPEDVGNYGVPLKIFDSLMGIALLAIGLAAPLLASAAASDGERFAGTLRQGLSVLLIGGTALALVLVASAEIVVTVVGGAEFSGSATTLRLFALLFVVQGPSKSYDSPWQLNNGETVPVIGIWYQDSNWLLVDINSPQTRTDCCWVSGSGKLNVNLSSLKSINTIPDRMDCSSVK